MLDNAHHWEEFVKHDPGLKDLGRLVGMIRTYVLLKRRIDLAPGAVTTEEGDPLCQNKPNQIKLPYQRRMTP